MMRKVIKKLSVLIAIGIIFVIPNTVKAASNGLTANYSIHASSTNVYTGGTFTVSIYVSGASEKIASNTITLNYDSSKFQYVSYSAPAPVSAADVGINATPGKIIYLYADNMGGLNAMSSGTVVTFTFKALNNVGSGVFTFTVSGVADQNALTYDVSGTNGSASVNVSKEVIKSSNNNLGSLSISGGYLSPAFNKDVLYYSATVDAPTTTISAVAEDSTAVVTGHGNASLNYGLNTYYVTVTAQNGAQKTYVLNITRPDNRYSSNTELSSLSVSDTNISYNGGVYYTATVPNNVKKVTINATAKDPKTKITGTGSFFLSVGDNTFVVYAVAESGVTKAYTVVISRNFKDMTPSEPTPQPPEEKPTEPTPPVTPNPPKENKSKNNYLEILEVDGATFEFDKEKLNYSITVPYTQDKLDIMYKTEDPKATVKVIAKDELRVGSNVIYLEVIAENGKIRRYQLIVVRNEPTPTTEYTSAAIIEALDGYMNVVVAIQEGSDTMLLDDVVATKLKETQKEITIKIIDINGNIKSAIVIDGRKVDNNNAISLDLNRKITDKVLINALEMNYVSINTKGANIPSGAKYRHYIDSMDDKYVLFYVDGKTVASKDLEVLDGYVEVELENNSNYAIVKISDGSEEPDDPEETVKPAAVETPNKKSGGKGWLIFTGATIALASGGFGAAYVVKKKKGKKSAMAEVDYLDLEPKNTDVTPAVENPNIDTIPAMDTLDIHEDTLSEETSVEILSIPNPETEAKDESTGAVETYHFEWQKNYFGSKTSKELTQSNSEELSDPKYEIKPVLSAEAIVENFVNAKIEFDFEPIKNNQEPVVEQISETVEENEVIENL